MTFPIVPDLRRNKARDLEGPSLDKAMPAYQLLQRQIVMNVLKERADQLVVSHLLLEKNINLHNSIQIKTKNMISVLE